MFQGDELEKLGSVALSLQVEGPQAVGEHGRLPLEQDAVVEEGLHIGGDLHVAAHLLLAAGGHDHDVGLRPDALVEGVVGGRIAGVQGDKHIEALGPVAVDVALDEVQLVKAMLRGDRAALLHQGEPQLHAGDAHVQAQRVNQVVVEGEGEVAAAGAHIDDVAPRGQGVLPHEAVDDLDELVDLLVLAAAGGGHLPPGGSDAQGVQVGAVGGHVAVLGAVVLQHRGGVGGSVAAQAGVALARLHDGELRVGGEEVAVVVHRRELLAQVGEPRAGGVVLGFLAVGVAVGDLQMGLLADHDRPRVEVAGHGGVLAARLAEGKLNEGARGEGGGNGAPEGGQGIGHGG